MVEKQEKRVTFIQESNRKPGPKNRSEQTTRGQDLQRRNQNYSNDGHLRIPTSTCQKFYPYRTPHTTLTIWLVEDRMINAKTKRSKGTLEINAEADLSTSRMGTGEVMESFNVHLLLREKVSHGISQYSDLEPINPVVLHFTGSIGDHRVE